MHTHTYILRVICEIKKKIHCVWKKQYHVKQGEAEAKEKKKQARQINSISEASTIDL